MHPADSVEAVGAFQVELMHTFVPVKSLATVETLTTVVDDTINNTHCGDGCDLLFSLLPLPPSHKVAQRGSLSQTRNHVFPGQLDLKSPVLSLEAI